jgi:acyl carrier protein
MDDLKPRVKQMIVDRLFLDATADQIGDAAPLMEEFGVDSVALFELALGLEDEFGIAMDEVDFNIDTFRTVNSIAAFVQERLDA